MYVLVDVGEDCLHVCVWMYVLVDVGEDCLHVCACAS